MLLSALLLLSEIRTTIVQQQRSVDPEILDCNNKEGVNLLLNGSAKFNKDQNCIILNAFITFL